MGRKKTVVVLPHLADADGDLSKDWYVEYSMRNPFTGQMKRFREYAGFKKLKTAEERYELAKNVINELTRRMKSGWTPFDRVKTTYEDNVAMETLGDFKGRYG